MLKRNQLNVGVQHANNQIKQGWRAKYHGSGSGYDTGVIENKSDDTSHNHTDKTNVYFRITGANPLRHTDGPVK